MAAYNLLGTVIYWILILVQIICFNLDTSVVVAAAAASASASASENGGDKFEQLEQFLEEKQVKSNLSPEEIFYLANELIERSIDGDDSISAEATNGFELIVSMASAAANQNKCNLATLLRINSAIVYMQNNTGRRVDKMAQYFGRRAMLNCGYFILNAYKSLSTKTFVIDKLSNNELTKFVLTKQDGSFAIKSSSTSWPDIIKAMVRHGPEEKCRSILCFKLKLKLKPKPKPKPVDPFDPMVYMGLFYSCYNYNTEGPGAFVTLSRAIETFTPEHYDRALALPKLFNSNSKEFELIKLRRFVCRKFCLKPRSTLEELIRQQ